MKLNFELENRLFEEASGETEGTVGAETETTETSEETTETEETEETEPEDDGLTEDEIKESRNLYKLLKDPSTNKDVLRVLAGKAGLLSAETKKEEVTATRKVADILKAKLGDKFDFLTPMLAEALEEILEGERAQSAAQIGELTQAQAQSEVQSVFNKLAVETKGASRNLEAKMATLSQKFPPGEGVSPDEYVRGLYAMATNGQSKGNAKAIADRINRNANDAASRLSSRSSGSVKDSPRNLVKMNLNQSIDHAIKSLGLNLK